jgi:hypothetical protein
LKRLARSEYFANGNRKNDPRDTLHGLLLRNSGSTDIAGKIADGVWPLRIGELDLMAAGGKLSRQPGVNISGANDSDLQGCRFAKSIIS